MAEDKLSKLRRLARAYGITFKSTSEKDWPDAHSSTFAAIKNLGDRKFDSYHEHVSVHASEQPWTQQIKQRAQGLANRSEQLFKQQRNETGWRLNLEPRVFSRFKAEVAWYAPDCICSTATKKGSSPQCRARVWRSEIEATVGAGHSMAQSLEEQRKNRKYCQCPPRMRPGD